MEDDSPPRQDTVLNGAEERGGTAETAETGEQSSSSGVDVGSCGWREVTVSGGE